MLYPEVPAAYSRKKINMSHLCLFVSSWHVPNTKRNQLSNWSWNFPENFSDLIHQTKTTPPNQHSPCNFAAIPANSFICRNYGWNIPPVLEIHFHSMTFVLLRILFATRKGWLPPAAFRNWYLHKPKITSDMNSLIVDIFGSFRGSMRMGCLFLFDWRFNWMGFNGPWPAPSLSTSDSNTAAKLAHCWPLLDGFNTGNISKLRGSGDRNVPFRLWAGSVLGTIQITEKSEPSIYHISSEEIALSQNTPK